MSHLNRRQWLQKSTITASLLALGCRTNFETNKNMNNHTIGLTLFISFLLHFLITPQIGISQTLEKEQIAVIYRIRQCIG